MNRTFSSLSQFEHHLERMMLAAEAQMAEAINFCAENTKEHIKQVMGDPMRLAPNAQSTIDQKGKDAPLVDTGELRESLTTSLAPIPLGNIGLSRGPYNFRSESGVGTEDEKMLWHEYGNGHYPPRPAMKIGTDDASHENQAAIEAAARSVVDGTLHVALTVRRLP